MASEVKEENNSTPPEDKNDTTDETKKVEDEVKSKESVQKETKEESAKEASEDDNEEDEEDEDEEEEEVALLDRPVEVTGCRARKKVERLDVSFTVTKEKQDVPEGKGKKLGECPRIEIQIQKIKVPELKSLHKILFNRTGSANEIKKNIRKFSGFPFEKGSTEYNRKKTSVEKLTASVLKNVCLILDIERGGTKEEIVNRIMSFLLKPEDSGKKVPSKKKASKEKKKITGKKVKPEKKKKVDKECDDEPEDSAEDEDDDSTGSGASLGGTDEEAEDAESDEPKQKSKDTKTSKTKAKVDKGKKDVKKAKPTKRKQDKNSSTSSEDEPPPKKSKMPSDEEISKLVKQILDAADLQEITMKKVIKQVSDHYPDFDLSHKKAFIKSTIKSVIS